MTHLTTRYLGIQLRSPLIASAGPTTADVESLIALEDAGAGAVVLPSLFEEQIEHDTHDVDRLLDEAARDGGRPPTVDDYNGGLRHYAELVEAAKSSIDIPVIASLNGASIGGWLRYARVLQAAGADALELNLYSVEPDPIVSSTAFESEQFGLVALLAAELAIPLAVKISPFYSTLASFVVGLQEAGASGVVMFNRFTQPLLDLATRSPSPHIELSTPAESRLALRWIALLRDHVDMSIAASSGIHTGHDAARAILAGADAVMTTSSLLRYGVAHLAAIERELRDWMLEEEVTSLDEIRGTATVESTPDPAAYERANYVGAVVDTSAQS